MGRETDAQVAALKRDIGALKERIRKLELGTASMREGFIDKRAAEEKPKEKK